MVKIKKAAKKCKRFAQKYERKKGFVIGGAGSDEELHKVKVLFLDSRDMAQNCQRELRNSELAPHIENCRQLYDKMGKYAKRFEEAAGLIDKYNPRSEDPSGQVAESTKYKSQIIGPLNGHSNESS